MPHQIYKNVDVVGPTPEFDIFLYTLVTYTMFQSHYMLELKIFFFYKK